MEFPIKQYPLMMVGRSTGNAIAGVARGCCYEHALESVLEVMEPGELWDGFDLIMVDIPTPVENA